MNDFFSELQTYLTKHNAQLIAVSKKQSPEQIMKLYNIGQRSFGENRAQELVEKAPLLPGDIQWHMIGHLQRNKLKQVLPLVSMVQSIDSERLLKAVNKMSSQLNKKTDILLQFHIAEEDSKYGFSLEDATKMMTQSDWPDMITHLNICGVMGMATFTDNVGQVKSEFEHLKSIFEHLKKDFFQDLAEFREISMGMSGDYKIAIESGSTMVRIGSLLFGERE